MANCDFYLATTVTIIVSYIYMHKHVRKYLHVCYATCILTFFELLVKVTVMQIENTIRVLVIEYKTAIHICTPWSL